MFVVISLLQTSFTDPGILPRATPEEAADIEKQIGKGLKGTPMALLHGLHQLQLFQHSVVGCWVYYVWGGECHDFLFTPR